MKNQQTILNHFSNKEYIKAADICRKSLNNDPNNLFYLNMISISYSAVDDSSSAIKYISKAFIINPKDRDTAFNYGTIMYEANNFDEAYIGFNALLNINDQEIRGWLGLGEVFFKKGDLVRAENMFLKCLNLDQKNITALMRLRKIYYHMLKMPLEEKIIDTILEFYPDNIETLMAKISNFIKQNKIKQAKQTFLELRACSKEKDSFAEDVVEIDLKWASGNKSDAIKLSERLTEKNPSSYAAWNTLANLRIAQSDIGNARYPVIKSYLLSRKDLEKNNVDMRRIFISIYLYYRMIKNYRVLLNIMKKWVRFSPQGAIPKYYLGETYLSMKDYQKGFQYYKYRYSEHKLLSTKFETIKEIKRWDGKESFNRLLILTEQGLGDVLMQLRVLKEIKNINNFEIYVDHRMINSIRRYFDVPVHDTNELIQASDLKKQVERFDCYIELGDSFEIFFRNNNKFEYDSKVIKADVSRNAYYKEKFYDNDKINIGISWATKMGRGQQTNLKKSDIDLLINQEKFNVIDLQYPYEGLDYFDGITKTDCVDKYNDINAFVDLMSCLDLVISIDNSTIHFAGSIGIESYLLLGKSCDWRWGDTGESTIWYDTVSIYRQSESNNFNQQISRIIDDIKIKHIKK